MKQKTCDILKAQRQRMKLTQKQVADRAGIQIQQYQKFESGERDIANSSFRIACRTLLALELNVEAFYKSIQD